MLSVDNGKTVVFYRLLRRDCFRWENRLSVNGEAFYSSKLGKLRKTQLMRISGKLKLK